MTTLPVTAPREDVLYIAETEAINYYDPLIKAIVDVESKGNVYAFNFFEQAVGAFQIRPCRINHYNELTGSNYTTDDCFDYELSREIFIYFAKGKSYERAARDWNGKWSLTKNYWKRVKSRL